MWLLCVSLCVSDPREHLAYVCLSPVFFESRLLVASTAGALPATKMAVYDVVYCENTPLLMSSQVVVSMYEHGVSQAFAFKASFMS